jgi:hypothetical protein
MFKSLTSQKESCGRVDQKNSRRPVAKNETFSRKLYIFIYEPSYLLKSLDKKTIRCFVCMTSDNILIRSIE